MIIFALLIYDFLVLYINNLKKFEFTWIEVCLYIENIQQVKKILRISLYMDQSVPRSTSYCFINDLVNNKYGGFPLHL